MIFNQVFHFRYLGNCQQEYNKLCLIYTHMIFLVMSTNEPPFIRIYQSCLVLMNIKRQLFSVFSFKIPQSSLENQDKSTVSSKLYMCLKKIIKESKNLFQELSLNSKKQNHIQYINNIIANLKSNSDYLTRQEKLIIQAKQMIRKWDQSADPLIYYQQKEREDLKIQLKTKMIEIKTCAQACQQSKQPLYIRQRERQLKDKLLQISQIERKFNQIQSSFLQQIKKKMLRLLIKILQAISSRERNTFIYDQKTLLFSRYIDLFQVSNKISQKQVNQYRKDLTFSIKNILQYLTNQKQQFSELISFLVNLEKQHRKFQKQYSHIEDEMAKQILQISPDISHIVSFGDILQLSSNTKKFFSSLIDCSPFMNQINSLKNTFQESILFTSDFLKNIEKRISGSKNVYIQQFIQDKKSLENLTKKIQTFQSIVFEGLKKFLQKTYRSNSQFERKSLQMFDSKQGRLQKSLINIFERYFKQTQKKKQSNIPTESQSNLSVSQQNEFNKIQKFVSCLKIFERQQNMDDSFQCSLGPRLLIHGRLKLLGQGLIYISNFNKKNIFFGKTRLFIPKEDIIQINKQTALVIFPDVIQVITKKGAVYFHALGKRQRMIQQLNSFYFPQTNNEQAPGQEVQFNQFKGDRSVYEAKIAPFFQPLENEVTEGEIPNISLRTFFHKFYSDEEFVYQGQNYKSFNYYSVKLAGGTNIEGTTFTPGIPFYFQVKAEKQAIQNDLSQSQRFFTYKKEVPMIPFVSKGGYGICQQKSVFRWGSPFVFVIDIYTTLSGFSLTQGMLVKARMIFEEKTNSVKYRISGQVTFENNSTINSMLRGPALSTLKSCMQALYQKIKKIQKHKKTKKVSSNPILGEQESEKLELKIEQLKQQNKKLKKIMKISIAAGLALYIITLIIFIVY